MNALQNILNLLKTHIERRTVHQKDLKWKEEMAHLLDDLELWRELAVLGGPDAGPGDVVFNPRFKSTAFGLATDLQ